jgi:hypothetical protein
MLTVFTADTEHDRPTDAVGGKSGVRGVTPRTHHRALTDRCARSRMGISPAGPAMSSGTNNPTLRMCSNDLTNKGHYRQLHGGLRSDFPPAAWALPPRPYQVQRKRAVTASIPRCGAAGGSGAGLVSVDYSTLGWDSYRRSLIYHRVPKMARCSSRDGRRMRPSSFPCLDDALFDRETEGVILAPERTPQRRPATYMCQAVASLGNHLMTNRRRAVWGLCRARF